MNTQQNSPPDQTNTLQQLLDNQSRGGHKKRWLGLISVIVLIGVSLIFFRSTEQKSSVGYSTVPVTIDTLVVKVSATGNLQPTNQVEVGSELSGIIDKVYVDDNDMVKQGQVLACLDNSKLQDAVAKSRANLVAAEAQVMQTQATVAEARATLGRYRQVAQLSGGKVPSMTEMDMAQATMKRATANEASAHASVIQAQANLQSDETDLAKANIISPINGVVLTREVELGQTVAASFQAPVLFTLAEDLAQMELQVDVDEADVGQVTVGQQASFTVDAWPGRKYEAVITRVGFGSQEKDGVVSYLTVLAVTNDDLSLRPGMTGNAEITTLIHTNALLVPNAALRFTPPVAETVAKKSGGSVIGSLMPRPPRLANKIQKSIGNVLPRVWVLRDGKAAVIEVQSGATNGRMTEIVGGELKAGMQVITETVAGNKP
jgi:HlyD family secretion protein